MHCTGYRIIKGKSDRQELLSQKIRQDFNIAQKSISRPQKVELKHIAVEGQNGKSSLLVSFLASAQTDHVAN